ncbi:MAG: DUF1631 family protein [Gammaproteobacteria bacterium]|nr:DUF1631 family protein [Gammaproteobacteria bacterium]
MNKRSSPRFPVTVDATVILPDGSKQLCTVRDYCSGGLYLVCNKSSADLPVSLRGQDVQVEFSDPLMTHTPVVHIEARVVRYEPRGLGLSFVGENTGAVIALSQLAATQAAKERGELASAVDAYGQATVDALIKLCRSKADEHVGMLFKAFVRMARDDLFEASNSAKSNSRQSAYFGAMNELGKAEQQLEQGFRNKVQQQFALLEESGFRSRFGEDQASPGGLSLVESDQLDNWLMVRAMASKLEDSLGETLEALETRLQAISVNPVTAEDNPIGPFFLASIFHEELERLTLEDAAKRVLFGSMGKVMIGRLKKLCDELNEGLIARGVLPTLAKKLELLRSTGGGSLPRKYAGEALPQADNEAGESTAPPPGYGVYTQPPAGGPYVPQTNQTQASATATAGVNQTSSGGASSGPSSPAAASNPGVPTHAASASPAAAPQAAVPPVANVSTETNATAPTIGMHYSRGNMVPTGRGAPPSTAQAPFHGVQELMRLRHASEPGDGEDAAPAATTAFSSEQVLQALGQMGGRLVEQGGDALAHVNALSRTLAESTAEGGSVLNEHDRDAVAYVGGLLSSIQRDPYLSASARPWFAALEVPLLKAGVLDGSLLEDDSHPARQILNRLERIADRLEGDDSETARKAASRIDSILQAVPEKVDTDPDVFANALSELDEVQEAMDRSYEENIKKLIAECDKERSINQARKQVLSALNDRLGQREVPVVVLNLLDGGWKNLLLRTMLKNGEDSVVYKTYLNVIDQLSARMTRRKPFQQEGLMENKKLLEWGSRMMSIISRDEIKNTAMLADIANHLEGRASQPPVTRKVAEIAIKAAAIPEDGMRPDEVSEDVWDLMLEDVRQLDDREAFRHALSDEKSQVINLVWKDSDAQRYVFADSRGNKALDLQAGQVSNYLYSKRLARMDDKEISITERATYSFLQNLHNQLAFQANHDQLTGLLSRKAFENELEQAYLESCSDGVSHVLAYMDLDRFNVINTTCGHAQGDVLLGQVAEVIRDTLKDAAIIARLGGDEFGMLLKQCSRTKGLMMITRVHDNLRKLQFACDENAFKITGSIGVSEVNAESESGGKLLGAVDSAAFTAKENGRDNIQIHNVENARISSRRSILDWVGRINVLFDKDLIQLRCQKIAPLHRTVNSLPHYEILLDVYDEERNKVPLDEFIVAAERYNRIMDIDNWVVDKVFAWLESHHDKLHRIDHVAINLSGVSIANRHFMERIYEHMQQEAFPSNKVCFELTETIAINNVDNAARFMRKLKETGCQFSLDDFGKGTSSYAYLRSLPIDYVKIDGAFVKDIASNAGDYAVVKSINEIAHVMGKQTIAEYVEDDFIYEALRTIGLDFVQGYGIEKPIPLENLFG